MTESRPPTPLEMAEIMRPAFAEAHRRLGLVATAMAEAWREALDSPHGRRLVAMAKLIEENPELAERLREATRPKPGCECLCARWRHVGSCEGYATTTVGLHSEITGPVEVSTCQPCATDVLRQLTPA